MTERSTQDIMNAAMSRVQQATGAATAAKTKATHQTQVAAQIEEEVSVSEKTAVELQIKNNIFYLALNDTQSTQEEKIQQIADALNPALQPMEKLHQNYKAFQEYYTYMQSENLEAAVEGVERMVKELEENRKVEVAKILKSLEGMLARIGESRELIEILRTARKGIDGKSMTVEQLSEAVKRNDKLVSDLRDLEEKKKEAIRAKLVAEKRTENAIADRKLKEGKWGFKLKSIFTTDTTYSDRVVKAEDAAKEREAAIANIDVRIAELNAHRNEALESGNLRILRSVDETDGNLSEKLINSGKEGVNTVRSAQQSMLNLMGRVVNSEAMINEISRRVSDKQVSLMVLTSGLQLAAKGTDDYKRGLEAKSAEAHAALEIANQPVDGSEPDILDVATKKTAQVELSNKVHEVIDYQGQLGGTVSEMQLTLTNNIDRQTKTENGKLIVQGTKKSVTILGRDGLNKVAENLETVLHSLVADQNDEMQQVVIEFARAANDMNRGMKEGMVQRIDEMHQKDMSYLDTTISLLKDSSRLVAETLERTVTVGVERQEKQAALRAATAELDSVNTAFQQATGELNALEASAGSPTAVRPASQPATPRPTSGPSGVGGE